MKTAGKAKMEIAAVKPLRRLKWKIGCSKNIMEVWGRFPISQVILFYNFEDESIELELYSTNCPGPASCTLLWPGIIMQFYWYILSPVENVQADLWKIC